MRVEIQPSLRFQSNVEYAESGEQVIRERGWLPGLGAEIAYLHDQLEAFGLASVFDGKIDYDGKLQNGVRYQSETGTRLSHVQLGLRYRLTQNTRTIVALERDEWKRNIKGSDVAIGLRERTYSHRLLLGVEQDWRMGSTGQLSLGATLVRARRERLDATFSGLFDAVSMRTQAATGYAINLRYQPTLSSRLQLGTQVDYIKVPQSTAHPITRNGVPAGAITQPEHVRQGVTLYVRYLL